jgi:ABC-2 type transport system ATP-binding protein
VEFIKIQNITKSFSNHIALEDVSFTINKGAVTGLLGPNGAGKTTLIRILNQITLPDNGQILFNGNPLHRKNIENIGYLPEERGLYKKMKVGEQSIYLARLKGLSEKEAVERLHYWFQKFDIESWWNRRVEELSKGMQQKLQFIVTIIHEPDFLIFDEPFSGFDPVNTNLLKQEILELKKKGATIIISTHNMASVEEICDDIVLIDHAKKILEGKLFDIKQKFKKHLFYIELADFNQDIEEKMPSEFIITQKNKLPKGIGLTLRIPVEMKANEILHYFINQSEIITFNEILPSMNEIFIETVQ